MLNLSNYNIFIYDKKCIFSAIRNDEWKLVSTINDDYIFPLNEPWFSKNTIFNPESESRLNTAINLIDNKEEPLSVVFNFKIDSSCIPNINTTAYQFLNYKSFESDRNNATLHLLKQGTDNINGVVDSYIIAAKCQDTNVLKFVFKVYFKRVGNLCINKFEYDIDQNLLDSEIRLYFSIDINDFIANLFLNEELKQTFPLIITTDYSLNQPLTSSDEMNHLKIGDKKSALKLKSATIFKNKLRPSQFNNIKSAIS